MIHVIYLKTCINCFVKTLYHDTDTNKCLKNPTFLHQWSVLSQVPQGGASLTVCSKQWMPSCAA